MSRTSGGTAGGGPAILSNPYVMALDANGQAQFGLGDPLNLINSAAYFLVLDRQPPVYPGLDDGTAMMEVLATDPLGSGILGDAYIQVTADGNTGTAAARFHLSNQADVIDFSAVSGAGVNFFLTAGTTGNLGFPYVKLADGPTATTLFALTGTAAMDMHTQLAGAPAAPAAFNVRRFAQLSAIGFYTEDAMIFDNGVTRVLASSSGLKPALYVLPAGQAAVPNLTAVGLSLFNPTVPPASLIPANSLKVGDIIRITASGSFTNTSGGAANMSVFPSIGGRDMYGPIPAVSIATGSTRNWSFTLTLGVRTLGIFGTANLTGWGMYQVSPTGGTGRQAFVTAVATDIGTVVASFDTTAVAALDFIATSSVTSPNCSATLDTLAIEWVSGS